MSKNQTTLMVFAVLELIGALVSLRSAIQSGGLFPWLSVVVSLLTAYLLYAAAKDASKIMGAWIILLVNLILNALQLLLTLVGVGAAAGGVGDSGTLVGAGVMVLIVYGVIIALNIVAFVAANNIKTTAVGNTQPL